MTFGTYRLRPQAEADLDAHARYIAENELDAALRLYDRTQVTLQMLADMPAMGTLYQTERAELLGIRFAPIKDYPRYLVFYRPEDGFIDVIRILHARVDKDRWL